MKRYLNTVQRKEYILLVNLYGAIQSAFIDGWAKSGNLTKEELKNLRTALTFLHKFSVSIMQRLDGDFVDKLQVDNRRTRVFILTDREAEIKIDEFERKSIDKIYQVPRAELDHLLEKAFANCKPCDCNNDPKCGLKKILTHLCCEVYDTEPPEGICPYNHT